MSDQKVLEAQQWVNATYGAVPGYVRCPENGRTGWSTMHSLTRGLQHELGVATLSDSVGPQTLAKLAEKGDVGFGFPNKNIVRIAQHALFCKGYNAGITSGEALVKAIQYVWGAKTLSGGSDLPIRLPQVHTR